ncbi:MAG: helix-turn-helix domain-containing protein [Planctomycetales bacterium]|nr:helix-turn-helix domain-containing protein [Planctomycetales bacterium]
MLTLSEAAKFLRLSERTLWKLVKSDAVPYGKVGGQYRFVRSQLLDHVRGGQQS